MLCAALTCIVPLIALSGCATMLGIPRGVDPNDRLAVANQTKTEYNRNTRITRVIGPVIRQGLLGHSYFLRVILPDTRRLDSLSADNPELMDLAADAPKALAIIQLYISASLGEWAFLTDAYSAGKQLDTTLIDRRVVTCSSLSCRLAEDVAIHLTTEDLERLAEGGTFEVELQGRRGSAIVRVPATYFRGFMDALRDQITPTVSSLNNIPRSLRMSLRNSPNLAF